MKKQFLEGMIKRHPDGFGFFIPDQAEHPDVYIPRHSMKGVMTSDRVMIEAIPERGSQRYRGEILKILSRGTKSLVGTFHKLNATTGLVRDEGKGWGEDLRVVIDPTIEAKSGELVAVEITSYPGDKDGFQGRIISVIGDAMDPLTDIKRVLLQNHIPHQFHPDVEAEAKKFSEHVSENDMRGRKDIRGLNFITIDGATAKDFDDAIFIESNPQGFKLYVAIADVSHYVKLGTAIDREAYERGTSVYFPNFVVPMLPEILSNGLCSLNPHLPRLALVAEIQMDFTGEVMKSEFYEAVIESKARVTYGEAQEVIDGNEAEKLQHVKTEILLAADLAKILMAKRFKDGSLDLEIPETQIVLGASGIPTDFIRSERLFAHRLIEEMMLAANVAVATFLSSKEIPAIYRVHESPNEEAITMLERYLTNFGSRVNLTSAGKLQKRLTKALQEFEGKPQAQILNILTLRSMSQAKYSSENLGHFGLGFDFYTHFTSPIRRYPDLIVHRLLKSQIQTAGYRAIAEEDLQTSATMLSACEQRSVKAERLFQSIKKARFMNQFIGEEFEGIVSSVTKFGVFVLLRKFEVDGLIRIENLSREKLEFDEDTLTLVGVKTGQRISIGDVMTVQVASADPEAGQVDFQLAGQPLRAKEKSFERPEKGRGFERHGKGRSSERGGGREKDRDREQRGGRGRDRDTDRGTERPGRRKEQPTAARSAARGQKPAAASTTSPARDVRSKKAQAMDKIEKHVIDFLTEANSESKNKGEKFDPEKHLQQALKKWKERMGDAAERPNHGVRAGRQDRNEERPGRRSTDRNEDRRSPDRRDRKDDRPPREDRESRTEKPAKPETKGFFKKFAKGPKAADPESPSEGEKKKSSFRGKRK
ncbi:MAG: ribonuclease R [Pseudobdellovibrionaceae bacterium]